MTCQTRELNRYIQNIPSQSNRIYILLKHTWIFSRIDHMLGHKTSLNKFKNTSTVFSNHNVKKLEVNYEKKTGQFTSIWRLNNMLLNNQWVKEEIKKQTNALRQIKMEMQHTKLMGYNKRSSCWECSWRKPRPPQTRSTMVEWHAKGRATITPSLLTHQPLPPRALGRAPPEPAHTPLPSPPLQPPCKPGWPAHPDCHLMGLHVPVPTLALSHLGSLLAPISASAPSCLIGSCAPATSGADSSGKNICTGGAETTPEPQGPCD